MSLIADALKAAQEEKSRKGTPDRAATARRFLSSAVTVGGRRGDAVRWQAPAADEMPRPIRIAAIVFGVAMVAAIGMIALAPGEEEAPSAPAVATRPSPTTGTPAEPAPAEAAPPEQAESPQEYAVTDDAGPPADAEPFEGEGYESGVDEPPAAAPARQPSQRRAAETAEGNASADAGGTVAAVPPSEPRERTAPAEAREEPARFQLRLQPTRSATVSSAFEQGLAAQRRRDFPAAIELYQRSIAEDPANAEALNNLGATYQAAGDLARARDSFRRALAVNPAFAAAWSNLAVALSGLGETGEAQAALAEAIRLDPSNHGAKVNLALQYQKQGLGAEARRLLEQVVSAAPQLAEAHYALGRLLEEQGDRQGAVRQYKLFLSTGAGRFAQLEPLVRQRVTQLGGNPDAR